MFWKRKQTPLNSQEYEYLVKRIAELNAEVSELKGNFKILETQNNNLRGQFNRKLTKLKEDEEMGQEETKGLNNSVLLPDDGAFRKFR